MFDKYLQKLKENEFRIEDPESIAKITNVANIMLRDMPRMKPGHLSVFNTIFKNEPRYTSLRFLLRDERKVPVASVIINTGGDAMMLHIQTEGEKIFSQVLSDDYRLAWKDIFEYLKKRVKQC